MTTAKDSKHLSSLSIGSSSSFSDDDKELEALGYVPSFKREFSNLATVLLRFFSEDNAISDKGIHMAKR